MRRAPSLTLNAYTYASGRSFNNSNKAIKKFIIRAVNGASSTANLGVSHNRASGSFRNCTIFQAEIRKTNSVIEKYFAKIPDAWKFDK